MTVIFGTANIDIFSGTENNDVINGLAGNDEINGLGGDDAIVGGLGDDIINGDAGNDVLIGEAGGDLYIYDVTSANSGFDTIIDNGTNVAEHDTLQLVGVKLHEMQFSQNNNDLLITFNDQPQNKIRIVNQYLPVQGIEAILPAALGGIPVAFDDFAGGVFSFQQTSFNVTEGVDPSVTLTIQRTLSSAGEATVFLKDIPISADQNDYETLPQGFSLHFAAGVTEQQVIIPIKTGVVGEFQEAFTIEIDHVSNGVVSNFNKTATVVIDEIPLQRISGDSGDNTILAGQDPLYDQSIGFEINGGGGRDVILGGAQGDIIEGGAGKDFLAGAGGEDVIIGNDGIDTLFGGADNASISLIGNVASFDNGIVGDQLIGGNDADFFKYNTGDGADLISDFENNIDKLVLNGSFALVDVSSGTFVDFGGGAGIIVNGINAADLADDIIAV